MKKQKNLLVTLACEGHIDQAKQLFSSAYFNAGWKGDYMLLAHKVPSDQLKDFSEKGILVESFAPFTELRTKHFPAVIFDKVHLFTDYFHSWDTVIYLDADIIVKKPLDELTKQRRFSAVRDRCHFKKQFNDPLDERLKNFHKNCFNVGVMVIKPDQIHQNFLKDITGLLKDHADNLLLPEQALLNIYFYKNWEPLPLTYNSFGHWFKENSKILPKIIHFASPMKTRKPWNKKNSFYYEWENNLAKFDKIDLNNIPMVSKQSDTLFKDHGSLKILEKNINSWLEGFNLYYLFLEKINFLYDAFRFHGQVSIVIPFTKKVIQLTAPQGLENIIGRLGKFIKKLSPEAYRKLKYFFP